MTTVALVGDPEPEEEAALLSVEDVAAVLGVDRRYVYRLVKRRQIRHFRIGKYLRFRALDVRAYVDGQAVPTRSLDHVDARQVLGLRGER